jgi:hypothetical protein
MLIQSIMIFSLGIFVTALIGIAVAPLIWARSSIVTKQQLIATLPLNEFEIKSSRDQLRSEHAIKAHRLESKLEQADQINARQLIEINRRELNIHELNNQIINLKQELAEKTSQNIVLLQNIDRKVPLLEDRANRLMTVLVEREREIQALKLHGVHGYHDASDDEGLYHYQEEVEQMRQDLGQEVQSTEAPRRTIIENAESIHEENLDLLNETAKLRARLIEIQKREKNETDLLRSEMQNIALTLMQEQTAVYRSQFHNIPNAYPLGEEDEENQLPLDFEFDDKKPVFLKKAEQARAEKEINPTSASSDKETDTPENSLTARLETLLKQK